MKQSHWLFAEGTSRMMLTSVLGRPTEMRHPCNALYFAHKPLETFFALICVSLHW